MKTKQSSLHPIKPSHHSSKLLNVFEFVYSVPFLISYLSDKINIQKLFKYLSAWDKVNFTRLWTVLTSWIFGPSAHCSQLSPQSQTIEIDTHVISCICHCSVAAAMKVFHWQTIDLRARMRSSTYIRVRDCSSSWQTSASACVCAALHYGTVKRITYTSSLVRQEHEGRMERRFGWLSTAIMMPKQFPNVPCLRSLVSI